MRVGGKMIEFRPHARGLVSEDKTVDIFSQGKYSEAISLESKDPSKSHCCTVVHIPCVYELVL